MNSEFILNFKGRNSSETFDQNFLWRNNSIYIMDNHRAALWCWLQHINMDEKYNLLHIDRHYDCLNSRLSDWIQALPMDIAKYSFAEYLELKYKPADSINDVRFVRYDNYLSLFLKRYSANLNECVFATHNKGVKPEWNNLRELKCNELIGNATNFLGQGRWILNIDLDYFFYPNYEEKYSRLLSDEFVDELFELIRKFYLGGNIIVVTLCLSPETCGGWEPAEILLHRMTNILNLQFLLPHRTQDV